MKIGRPHRYRFVITGASGNVGRHLIPILARRGNRILAVGRDVTNLRQLYANFEEVDVCEYEDLAECGTCDTFIHLAVHNNNKPGTLDDYLRVNVDFALRVCRQFDRMGGKRFINVSSIQSIGEENSSFYAVSKNIAHRRISETIGDRIDSIHIGYFYDIQYFGERLNLLTHLGFLGAGLFSFFKILKPTTSADSLADYVLNPPKALAAPAILTDDLSKSWIYRIVMRSLDISVAACILIMLLPLLVLLWALIRLDSPGPAIFAQTRLGKGKTPFTLFKFRTMKRGTAAAGTHEVSINAVTKAGRFLRRTKLDELPQAINLLRGDMTLVGPRPCLPVQEELVNTRQALGVYKVKPGITGYAQIREIDMSRPSELAKSEYLYTKLQSLELNLKIIMLTMFGRGSGDRVASAEQQ